MDSFACMKVEQQIETKYPGYFKKTLNSVGFRQWLDQVRNYFSDNVYYPFLEIFSNNYFILNEKEIKILLQEFQKNSDWS
jgi:hypothetical protein